MVIEKTCFMHKGGFYHYRVNFPKLKMINEFPGLVNFLEKMFGECPDEYFDRGPRSSCLKFNLNNLNLKEIRGHEVNTMARMGLMDSKERTAHTKVQCYMLEKDTKTIAVEVPIWLESNELDIYEELFQSGEQLTGHIDLVGIDGGKIWIWDYKPNAHKEKYASTQIYFYALMLSKRTGISLDNFRCGYFDSEHTYVFNPSESLLPKITKINDF